eukprot:32483-Prymnesium_polylepis.1
MVAPWLGEDARRASEAATCKALHAAKAYSATADGEAAEGEAASGGDAHADTAEPEGQSAPKRQKA